MVSSRLRCGELDVALRHFDVAALGGELRGSASIAVSRIVDGRLADEVAAEQARLPVEVALRVGEVDLGFGEAGLGIVELRPRRRPERRAGCVSSSRAMTWPSLTWSPSSMSSSTILPVIFDATVAWRRATTYPEASRIEEAAAAPSSAADCATAT